MPFIQILVLAIIQGVTEFLPVSSSGHVILVPAVTGWPDQGLAIDVSAHVGTLVAVLIYFWRDVGRAFVAHLCAQPDLEATRARLSVPLPAAALAALAAGAPPMAGGEYLTVDALAALWEAMNAACRAELAEFDGPVEAYVRSQHYRRRHVDNNTENRVNTLFFYFF